MASNKQDAAAKAALAALHIGETEQLRRMPLPTEGKRSVTSAVKKVQVSVQFSVDGLLLLQKAQARLLERGVRRAGNKGTTLEIVLMEWLEKIQGRIVRISGRHGSHGFRALFRVRHCRMS